MACVHAARAPRFRRSEHQSSRESGAVPSTGDGNGSAVAQQVESRSRSSASNRDPESGGAGARDVRLLARWLSRSRSCASNRDPESSGAGARDWFESGPRSELSSPRRRPRRAPLRLRSAHQGLFSSRLIVKPDTLIGWHRQVVRRHRTSRHKRTPGRPPSDSEAERLVLQLAQRRRGLSGGRLGDTRVTGQTAATQAPADGPIHLTRPSASDRKSRPLATARPSQAGGASSVYSASFSPLAADATHRRPPILPS